ncbi:hypothetical protein M2282_004191 [Variovorax boronicumulans]|uniref:BcsR/BcsP family cellulose biosynthesis protein n=1 Tax=Variovorax boronicumulans TaxID=436515 RepID=UPI002476BAAA|nr:BcsR/BcsP family cellulose biosynthesis protein [Variovorax boronicumulans]MDH6169027.1 hypothetical protein [Variovorax boronicumulans]
MSQNDRSAEDVAGLFRKFGGDAHNYKEFDAPEAEAQAVNNWPLLSGGPIDRTPVAAPALSAAPVLPAAPVAPTPPPSSAAAPFNHAPVHAPAPGRATSELQALFARLADPQRHAPPAGPMSRWRRPT